MDKLKIVRFYDAFDGWIDLKGPCTEEEAKTYLAECTDNGTKMCERNKSAMGEYYCIFDADTTMMIRPETLGR